MQPNQANIAAMGQTARASASLQGSKPAGPLGVVSQPGDNAIESQVNAGLQAAKMAGANIGAGPGATINATGVASGQTTGLISGQMMNRRI